MIELRDQKVAHLISLGGWLRSLEISERQSKWIFRPNGQRFSRNMSWSTVAHRPFFEKLRSGLTPFTFPLSKATGEGLNLADVKVIHAQARELNLAIRQSE